jgi:hypothetical protein
VTLILGQRSIVSPQRALLVAVSGIDGAGKGYLTDPRLSKS